LGQKVMPKKGRIQFGDRADGAAVYFELKGIVFPVLSEENGWLRIADQTRREGWVDKADFVLRDEAYDFYTDLVQQNAQNAWAWTQRGLVRSEKGDLDEAIKDYTEAIRLDAKQTTALRQRGNAWFDKRDFDRAIKDYDEAIRLEPNDAVTLNSRGNAWSDKKDLDRAIKDYDAAIRVDPRHVAAYYNRGVAWAAKNDYDRAINDYDVAIRLAPNAADAFNNRGEAWLNKKAYDKAIRDFDTAIRIDNGSFLALNNKAWLLATCPHAQFRDGQAAVALAKAAGELTEWKNRGFFDTLAAAYAECGQFDKAVVEQKKVLADASLDAKSRQEYEARLKAYEGKQAWRD
jgi:tetratricopeptide (TPR) repeat protein